MRSPSRAIIIAVTGLLATLGACTFNPADNQRSRWPVVAISAPEGMATDLSSVSRIAWSIVNRVGPHLEASLLYDWLDIETRAPTGDVRRFADAVFLADMVAADVRGSSVSSSTALCDRADAVRSS